MRLVATLTAVGCISAGMAFGQAPRFLAADVHPSAKTPTNQFMRAPAARGEIYEIKNATMADLIGLAYNTNITRVLGGPSWLEMDRFDVLAKQPLQTAPDTQRAMLQALLAERFQLVVREGTQPMPNYALAAGRNPKLKEADGSGDKGCKPQSSNAPAGPGMIRLSMLGDSGTPVQLSLENGMIEYRCRNMTMAEFASGLRGLLGANLGQNPVLDQTGLTGVWNFDLKYSLGIVGLPGAAVQTTITIFEAIDKQLGLKLEETQVPTPVVVVVSVNSKPSENPPGTAEALPPNSIPKEFEVATIKPSNTEGPRRSMFQLQPGGRLVSEGMPLAFLITRAFNPLFAGQVAGIPSWAETMRFDLSALASSEGSTAALDPDALAPMMLALLKERFGLTYHTEEREVQAYDLVAGKPKMKEADPASRAWCKDPSQVPGAAPALQGSRAMICQNITMTQFAELLRGRGPGLEVPVLNATRIEGGWDFRLTYSPLAGQPVRAPVDGAAPSPVPAAADPVAGDTIFEAIERQLGLKLEKTKRTVAVTVIDHIDQEPSEN